MFNFKSYLQRCRKQFSNNNGGFTVLELIVSMSLFVIISVVVVGSFISALRVQQTIVSLIEARDNMGIAMEQMSREIRLGTNFEPTGENELKFYNLNGDEISYVFDEINKSINRCKNFDCSPIIYGNLKVEKFTAVHLNFIGDKRVPNRVTIGFLVAPKEEIFRNKFLFNIQTTVSVRQF